MSDDLTTKTGEEVAFLRGHCEHLWQRVGFQERSPTCVAVVYACEKCSSYTYREMQFVGYRLSSLEDDLREKED